MRRSERRVTRAEEGSVGRSMVAARVSACGSRGNCQLDCELPPPIDDDSASSYSEDNDRSPVPSSRLVSGVISSIALRGKDLSPVRTLGRGDGAGVGGDAGTRDVEGVCCCIGGGDDEVDAMLVWYPYPDEDEEDAMAGRVCVSE